MSTTPSCSARCWPGSAYRAAGRVDPDSTRSAAWSADDLSRYGPFLHPPLGLDWVAVREWLRLAEGADSGGLHGLLLDAAEQLGEVMRDAAPDPVRHVKVPLGVAILGVTLLLPPRYLNITERGQRRMHRLLKRDAELGALASACDERSGTVWGDPASGDEFDDQPRQLAALVRVCPPGWVGDLDVLTLPMGALAAPKWEVLGPTNRCAGFDPRDLVGVFRAVADAFYRLGLGFLHHGVMPGLHGQNVIVVLRDGAVEHVALQDHDTVRPCPQWMDASGMPDTGHSVKPRALQSLHLPQPRNLLGYLQTLGLQVNLYGVADALCRQHGVREAVLSSGLRQSIVGAADRLALPVVRDLVGGELLRANRWPSLQVLRPLLRQGRSVSVRMPASTSNVPNPLRPRSYARTAAEAAARRRLLNAFLRETSSKLVEFGTGALRGIRLPNGGYVAGVEVTHWSVFGFHDYAAHPVLLRKDGDPAAAAEPIGHGELVALVLDELDTDEDRKGELRAQMDSSVERTARYLEHGRPPRQTAGEPRALTRRAEQGLLLGHPFHPTPKSAEGFDDSDLERYAPELGVSFVLHYLAAAPGLVLEKRLTGGEWVPAAVRSAAAQVLGPDRAEHSLLPVHPWQARYLLSNPRVRTLVAEGALVALGPLGRPVYPTSSVRTVCDPEFGTAWKLPLHVRITNFVRNNPIEHLTRATDAATIVDRLRRDWAYDGFGVLLECGYRTLDPAVVGDELAADVGVLYRENPFCTGRDAPRVLAALLEEGPGDAPPELVHCVLEAAGGSLSRELVAGWLRRYLRVSLLPLLAVFGAHGVSFEAHAQNSLLHTEAGWPVRYWVRDLEGVSVVSERLDAGDGVPASSPARYNETEAWLRLRYHAVTGLLGQLVHVLGRYCDVPESALWTVVAGELQEPPARFVAARRWADELVEAVTLPAKANLHSRLTGQAERPVYVDVPNPMREVNS